MRIPKGFTLVELMVVVAIIAILASVLMVGLSEGKAKSRDSRRVSDINNIRLALAQYYGDYGKYPYNIYSDATFAPYMSRVPTDPGQSGTCAGVISEPSCYRYASYRAGTSSACNATNPAISYQLGAILETDHAELVQDADASFAGFTTCAATMIVNGFIGTSADCTTAAGTAAPGGTERCYSQRP